MGLENLRSAFSNLQTMEKTTVTEVRDVVGVYSPVNLKSASTFPILDTIQRQPSSFVSNDLTKKLYTLETFDSRQGRLPSGTILNKNTYKGSIYYSGIGDGIEEFGISGNNMDELFALNKDIGSTQDWSKLYRSDHSPKEGVGYNYSQFVNRGKLDIRSASRTSSLGSWSRYSTLFKVAEPYIISEIGDAGRRKNRGFRSVPIFRAKTDVERLLKFLGSARGAQFIAQQQVGFIKTNVVREKDGLKRRPQRYNKVYNPLSPIASQLSRLLGQAVPNVLFKRSEPPDIDKLKQFVKLGAPKPGRTKQTDWNINDSFTQGSVSEAAGGGIGGMLKKEIGSKILSKLKDKFGGVVSKTYNDGDHATLLPIRQGSVNVTGIAAEAMSMMSEGESMFAYGIEQYMKVAGTKYGMPFYFKDLRDNSYLFFRAYIEGLTENVSPSWSSTNYIGRSEPTYIYERAEREINFTLKLFAQTQAEHKAIWTKINRLTSMCYPEYKQDEIWGSPAKTRMKPPMMKLRLGDMYGAKNWELTGFIKSLAYEVPSDSPWETSYKDPSTFTSVKVSGQPAALPKYIIVTLSYQVVHEQVPNLNFVHGDNIHHFYGGPEGLPMGGNHIREMSEAQKSDGAMDKLGKVMEMANRVMDAKESVEDVFDVKDLIKGIASP